MYSTIKFPLQKDTNIVGSTFYITINIYPLLLKIIDQKIFNFLAPHDREILITFTIISTCTKKLTSRILICLGILGWFLIKYKFSIMFIGVFIF